MKKTTVLYNIAAILILSAVIIGFVQPDKSTTNTLSSPLFSSGNKISKIISEKKQADVFKDYTLFNPAPSNARVSGEFVKDASFLTLKRDDLKKILDDRAANMTLNIPMPDNKVLQLELTRVNVLTKD